MQRRSTTASLGCPFFFAVRRFSAGALLCAEIPHDSIAGRAARLHRVEHGDHLVCLPAAFCPRDTPFCQVFKVLDCNSGMSRSRESLAGSRIAAFTLTLIWAPEQPTIYPARKAAALCSLPSNQRAPMTPSAGLFSTCGFRLQTVATCAAAIACLRKSTAGYRAKNC